MVCLVQPVALLPVLQISLTLLIPSRAAQLAVVTVLASLGFGLICIVKISSQPARASMQVSSS